MARCTTDIPLPVVGGSFEHHFRFTPGKHIKEALVSNVRCLRIVVDIILGWNLLHDDKCQGNKSKRMQSVVLVSRATFMSLLTLLSRFL